jgi:hypothetical protein
MNIVEKYNQFQNQYGANANQDHSKIIEDLFMPGFNKIANGQIIASKRDELNAQLQSIVEFAGKFEMNITRIIPSANKHDFVVRYILTTEKAGKFDVMAVIFSKDGIKIDNIDEIYYQVS